MASVEQVRNRYDETLTKLVAASLALVLANRVDAAPSVVNSRVAAVLKCERAIQAAEDAWRAGDPVPENRR